MARTIIHGKCRSSSNNNERNDSRRNNANNESNGNHDGHDDDGQNADGTTTTATATAASHRMEGQQQAMGGIKAQRQQNESHLGAATAEGFHHQQDLLPTKQTNVFGGNTASFPSFSSLAAATKSASSVGSKAAAASVSSSSSMKLFSELATAPIAAGALATSAFSRFSHTNYPQTKNENEDVSSLPVAPSPPTPPRTKKIKTEFFPPVFPPNHEEVTRGFDDSTDDDETNNFLGGYDAAADPSAATITENQNDVSHDEQEYHYVVVKQEEVVEQVTHDDDDDDDLEFGEGGATGENDMEDNNCLDGGVLNSIKDEHNNNNEEDDDDDVDSVDFILSEDDPNANLAFCCQNCSCLDTKNVHRQYYDIRNNCGNSSGGTPDGGTGIWGNTLLYHRGCCHGNSAQDDDYLSPMQEAIEKGSELKRKAKQRQGYTQTQIKKMYNTAMREEAQFENEEFNEDSLCSIHSNSTYNRCCILFQERTKILRRTPLRVLDLFSGIGSGTVVLKRLRLPISVVVHVEHDPVAVAVCKFNTDNDRIDHRYIENFEDIYGQGDEADDELVASFMQKHGPIDLVLGAAPCQNYSGLNARSNRSSENAQYLLKIGRLVHKLNGFQMSRLGVKDKVLFLSENVVFSNHDEVDKSYSIGEDESLPPMCVDAKDFGPCKRKRFYWINMPVNSSAHVKEVASFQSVDQLLDEGYGAVARLVQGEDMTTTVKANTFLASLSKIDDDRMLKCKVHVGSEQPKVRYHRETYSISERERMMGLPIGYVQHPVCRLFSELTENAFIRPETSAEGKTYRDFLPRQFWHLRRVCKFKFRPCPEPPFFQLALSSPLEGKNELSFFTADEYGKHLIGNGWSIPVVEHLLGKLKDLFAEDSLVSYQGYDINHPWEPYQSM